MFVLLFGSFLDEVSETRFIWIENIFIVEKIFENDLWKMKNAVV